LIINQKPTAAMGTLLCEPEGKHPHDLHDTRGCGSGCMAY